MLRGNAAVYYLCHLIEIRPLFKQPGRGIQVFRRGGGIGERACILVYAKQKNGGIPWRDGNTPLPEKACHKGGVCPCAAKKTPARSGLYAVIFVRSVVVIDNHLHFVTIQEIRKPSYPSSLAGIHHHQPSDIVRLNFLEFFQGKACIREITHKLPEGPFHGAWQYDYSSGIEKRCCNSRRESVKIRVEVGGYDGCMRQGKKKGPVLPVP